MPRNRRPARGSGKPLTFADMMVFSAVAHRPDALDASEVLEFDSSRLEERFHAAEQRFQAKMRRYKAAQNHWQAEMQRFESEEQVYQHAKERMQAPAVKIAAEEDGVYGHSDQLMDDMTNSDQESSYLDDVLTAYGRLLGCHGDPTESDASGDWFLRARHQIASVPCIVKFPGGGYWSELACPVCHGNSSPAHSGNQLRLLGLEDFFRHLEEVHGTFRERGTLCDLIVRDVSPSTVYLLRAGIIKAQDYIKIKTVSDDRPVVPTPSSAESVQTSNAAPVVQSLIQSSNAAPVMQPLVQDWSKVKFDWGSRPENFLDAYPSVVKHPNDKWYLLECPVCHGNCSASRKNSKGEKNIYRGARAFRDHLIQGHGEARKNLGLAATIERCQVRELTRHEVRQLLSHSPDAIIISPVGVKRVTAGPDGLSKARAHAHAHAQAAAAPKKRKASAEQIDHDDAGGNRMDFKYSADEPQAKKQKPLESSGDLQDVVYAEDVEEPAFDRVISAVAPRFAGAGTMSIPIRARPMA
ncbi:hypothetical protein LTR10_002973 [Elasticomyces elasticus]|nr:hypothetical protein LTR10_002973 [Elasticomyces elasticus]KAK4967689.1 hypothetical protein LTR42_010014 [Elasticomyces elasticus]